jgi:hypothetical protein
MTRRQFEAVVECEIERKRAVGFEVVQPAHEVLPVDRNPAPFDAAVNRPHPVSTLSILTPGANAPVEKVRTPSELYSEAFSGLD